MTTFGLAALASSPAARAAADPAEIAFWQSVQDSKDPREYQLYLNAYPNGAFAALAQSRLVPAAGPGGLQPIPLPAPGPQTVGVAAAPAPVPAPDDDPPGPALTITPAGGRVGQVFTIGCVNLPENSSRDVIIVVRAGSPVLAPDTSPDQMKVLTSNYTANCRFYNNTLPGFGPYAPGNYEARFMSILYNDDHRFEMKAKIAFSVR
jgi:hypothetical protein